MRVVRSVPEDNHADQDERGGNGIPDKVDPMDALTATKAVVFVIGIKAIPALFHLPINRGKIKQSPCAE